MSLFLCFINFFGLNAILTCLIFNLWKLLFYTSNLLIRLKNCVKKIPNNIPNSLIFYDNEYDYGFLSEELTGKEYIRTDLIEDEFDGRFEGNF